MAAVNGRDLVSVVRTVAILPGASQRLLINDYDNWNREKTDGRLGAGFLDVRQQAALGQLYLEMGKM